MSRRGGYDIFLGPNRFPVTPESLSLKIRGKNRTLILINEGEVNLLKLPGLTEITAEFLIPARPGYSWAVYPDGFRPPEFFFGLLERMKTEKNLQRRAAQFIVVRSFMSGLPQTNTNIRVTVEDYEIKQSSKDGFDFIVSVKFLQYKDFEKKTVTPVGEYAIAVAKSRAISLAPDVKTLVLVAGETLHSVAKKYLDDAAKFTEIAKLNNLDNPFAVAAGIRLVLP